MIKRNALDPLDHLDSIDSRSKRQSKNEGNHETGNSNALDLQVKVHAQKEKIEGNEGNEGNTSNDKGGADHNIRARPYSDFLIDGIPKWEIENRGMTHEEAEAFKEEIARIGRRKVADMTDANISGNGIMGHESSRNNTTCLEGS